MKWKWIERAWQERPEWIKRAKNSFNSLLVEYEHQQHPQQTPPSTTPPSKRARLAAYDNSSSDDDVTSESSKSLVTIQQQLVTYQSEKVSKALHQKDSPIQ